MNDVELEARVRALNVYHQLAAVLLTFDCVNDDATDPWGRFVRRWAQACKLSLIDGMSLRDYELQRAVDQAIERAFHPDRVLERNGFVLPGLAVARR